MRSVGGPSSSSSSSSSPAEVFSIRSRQVQDEFLRERWRRLGSSSDVSSPSSSPLASPLRPSSPQASPQNSPLDSPFSPAPSDSPSSPRQSDRSPALSLSSPELLSELKKGQTQPMRRVSQRTGMTTVFSGRGRQVSGSSPEA